ncbi:MAG: DUF5615 family PIN-like protein, partial [Planctomycetaceae bacterium]|nr:DUF5615 family PIN-like protein [Planctomycetaceae bacterium]
MMRFKLDENFGIRGLTLLHRSCFDAETVADEHLCGSSDTELINVCNAEQRCLITLDADFADVLKFPPEQYAGIVYIKTSKQQFLDEMESAIETL